MSNVFALPGKGPCSPSEAYSKQLGPVKEVIEILEEYLKDAKEGKIRAVGLALVRNDGYTATGFALHPDEASAHQLMAAITYLQFRYAMTREDSV